MKKLITIIALMASVSAFAEGTFKNCQTNDLEILREANSFGALGLSELALEAADLATDCKVKHEHMIAIALCGATKPHFVTYKFDTNKYGKVEVKVDYSQVQCYEIYKLPTIESVKMTAK